MHLILSFRPSQENCSSGEENLILGHWEGSSKGCLCNDSFKEEECNKDDSEKNCSVIGGNKRLDYKKINSLNICVRKSKE